jgi:hypothetical protein
MDCCLLCFCSWVCITQPCKNVCTLCTKFIYERFYVSVVVCIAPKQWCVVGQLCVVLFNVFAQMV